MNFKGGKGIASTFGLFWISLTTENGWFYLVVMGFLLITLFYIWTTEWGSMGSLFGVSMLAFLQAAIFYVRYEYYFKNPFVIMCFMLIFAICALTWYAHRKNILRLLAGEEHHTSVKQLAKHKLAQKSKTNII
jgi:glycerol-3-phosphate acyltransferase PlsY